MGGILSYLFGSNTGRTDDPDPATGLTSRDKYLIRQSWDLIKKDLTGNGVKIFCRLFEKYPDEQIVFPFRDIPRDKLAPNKKFQAHCNSVMYAFTSIVDALDDVELLVNILQKIGDSHHKRNLKVTSMDHLKEVLLEIFQIFPKDTIASWQKALDVSFKIINKQLTG